MIDWTSSMQQTFEYYIVDPNTWKDIRRLEYVTKCSITRDLNTDTLGSATIELNEDIGESYVRVYLVATQNGITEKFPLATFLAQTPSVSFNGRYESYNVDAYFPLLELKEKKPPIGYSIYKEANIMEYANNLTEENLRAPVVRTNSSETLKYDFVADPNKDTWLTYIKDLIASMKYRFDIDELGRILFSPNQDLAALKPVWSFNDNNSSILYPDIELNRDLYGIPNVVEVIYSNGTYTKSSLVKNVDENSPVSIQSRGREIKYTDPAPDLVGLPTQSQVDEYAYNLLKNLSSLEYNISYSHAYCPVRPGDAVRINYTRAGLKNVVAKVTKQIISCVPGCPVQETAVYTTKFWR